MTKEAQDQRTATGFPGLLPAFLECKRQCTTQLHQFQVEPCPVPGTSLVLQEESKQLSKSLQITVNHHI